MYPGRVNLANSAGEKPELPDLQARLEALLPVGFLVLQGTHRKRVCVQRELRVLSLQKHLHQRPRRGQAGGRCVESSRLEFRCPYWFWSLCRGRTQAEGRLQHQEL